MATRTIAAAAALAVAVAAGALVAGTTGRPSPAYAEGSPTVTVAAVGDMACDSSDSAFKQGAGTALRCAQKRVSDAVVRDTSVTAVLGLGDYQYDCGDAKDYQVSYTPTWGRLNPLMDPVAGNHEYQTGKDAFGAACPTTNTTAANYFAYFGSAAHVQDQGHFSFDLGAWHVVALNGNCSRVGGCSATSTQTKWLAADLAADTQPCTLAYWHQPLFTGLSGGPATAYRPWWTLLHDAGADVVLNGHVHDYQRYAALAPDGTPDTTGGITQYVVGTGGEKLVSVASSAVPHPVVNATTFGYLRLHLADGSWSAEYLQDGGQVLDASSGTCHHAPAASATAIASASATDAPADSPSATAAASDPTTDTATDTATATVTDTATDTATPPPTTPAPTPVAPSTGTELFGNGSVEASGTPYLGTYSGSDQVSWSTAAAHTGTHSVRIRNTAASAQDAGLANSPVTVTSTTAGATYEAHVWVRATAARQVVWLRLLETGQSASVAKVTLPDTAWHEITWPYVAHGSGHQLGYQVVAKALVPTATVYADDFGVLKR